MNGFTLRIVAACVLTACCGLAGRSLAASCFRRAQTLQSLGEAVEILKVHMLDRLAPLGEALKATGHPALLQIAQVMGEQGGGANAAWQSLKGHLTSRGQLFDSLSSEDVAELDALMGGLGLSGASQQRVLLDASHKSFNRLTEAARKKAQEQGKLYTSLGLLAGLSLAIILL